MTLNIILVIAAYLAGSLSSAIILCRLAGLPDPREKGSGNPGATNVLRYGGKKLAALVLAGDALKGFLPVLLAQALGVDTWVLGATAVAAFLGHLYPVFFEFKGGKGVATAFGAFFGLSGLMGLAICATWLVMAVLFRYSSLAALTATALSPVYLWFFTRSVPLLSACVFIVALLFWRHRSNIRNLMNGGERKIGYRD
jgi:glycerol-3-phosphate acyltransferase PlsY